MSEPFWQPTPEQVAASNMTAFMRCARAQWGRTLPGFEELYQWSIDQPEEFWSSVWEFCGVRPDLPPGRVLVDGHLMPGARWFPEARFNFARNLLRFDDNQRALVFWNETGFQRALTYAQLRRQVSGVAQWLRGAGVRAGDRVAGFLPNLPEAVVAMLAAASLGATWSSCSPDFGVRGLLDRFGQIEPKVLFTADGYCYDGKAFDSLVKVREARRSLRGLEQVVVVPYLEAIPRLEGLEGALTWQALIDAAQPAELEFASLPFDHPLYILYSSGTTGLPKCIVHSAGGVLLQILKEHVLHCDLKRGDVLFYFTTCGWMMWNWLVNALAVGCQIVLYDGSPLFPRPSILFEMAQQEGVTVFGTSPRYLVAIEKAGLAPRAAHDLGALRLVLSTGAPLSGESFDYVCRKVKPNIPVASISGGTDLCSCFALGNPIAPVYRGQLQTRGLGMKVLVYDDLGQPVVGQKGELVCAAPFPSMPVGFWQDSGGALYRRTYFQRFPGVWHHGDFAELTGQGGMVIYGRSDAVLNPGGVRIGTAEIYRQVEQVEEVLECVAVAQEWGSDVRILLFVKLREGVFLDEALVARIKDGIRRHATPRHVPALILETADIPRTKSGKLVELAVREAIHGRPVRNLEALANPEALVHFKNRPELRQP